MEPLVSIVTPNYNCEKYIAETIESVIAQTYTNWEMFIIDDCSTDKSYEIAKKYSEQDSRIKVYKMEKNSGAALCRNKAIELSKGKYIAFLDSDDLWTGNKLQKQAEFMEKEGADFSYTRYTHMDEGGKSLGLMARIPNKLSYRKMLFHCYTGCLTVMYNQEKIGKVYGPNISKSNDYGLFLQVLKKVKKARALQENTAFYRIRQGSISRNKFGKVKPHFYLLNSIEKINPIASLFCIFTNVLIKKIYKYERV